MASPGRGEVLVFEALVDADAVVAPVAPFSVTKPPLRVAPGDAIGVYRYQRR
jgi:hypothetical protein